jgi:malate dehydrogenase
MAEKKVTLIGCGQVGTIAALELAHSSLADLVLYDVVDGLARGRALDLAQAASPVGFECRVTAVDSLAEALDSDIFVITAGKPRLPGMSRADLVDANSRIIRDLARATEGARDDALFVIVTNPLDVMVTLFVKESGRERTRVIGMGGILDSARMAYFTSLEAQVPPTAVDAWVLGAHADSMVPCFSLTTIDGEASYRVLTHEQQERIAERTRNGGAEIVAHLKTGSAFIAPGASVALLVTKLLAPDRNPVPVSVVLEGEYGLSGAALGVPAELSDRGVVEVVELPLFDSERTALHASFEEVRSQVKALVER